MISWESQDHLYKHCNTSLYLFSSALQNEFFLFFAAVNHLPRQPWMHSPVSCMCNSFKLCETNIERGESNKNTYEYITALYRPSKKVFHSENCDKSCLSIYIRVTSAKHNLHVGVSSCSVCGICFQKWKKNPLTVHHFCIHVFMWSFTAPVTSNNGASEGAKMQGIFANNFSAPVSELYLLLELAEIQARR